MELLWVQALCPDATREALEAMRDELARRCGASG
jgi:hypothetical protein